MKMKLVLLRKISGTPIVSQLRSDRSYRSTVFAVFGLILNLLYAFCHGALGIANRSVWFITSCIYYLLLSTMRFSVLVGRRTGGIQKEHSLMRRTGILFGVMSLNLSIVIYISLSQNIAAKHGEIVMIAIAAYTFTKISMAVVSAVKYRGGATPLMTVVQNIRYMEVAVSVLTLQRSMLVSFGDMERSRADTMNMLTGAGVCAFTMILGFIMIRNSKKKRS